MEGFSSGVLSLSDEEDSRPCEGLHAEEGA